jgi:hypothetical protein
MARSKKYKNHKKRVSKRRKQRTRSHSNKSTNPYLFNGGNNIVPYSVPSNAYAFNSATGTGGDPIAASNVVSTSNLPNMTSVGGKRSKMKRMKGGSIVSSINDFLLGSTTGASANPALSFGSTLGIPQVANMFSGIPSINSATHIQSTSNMFSNTNPPLV